MSADTDTPAWTVLEQLTPRLGDTGDAGRVAVDRVEDQLAGPARHPPDERLCELSEIRCQTAGISDRQFHRDVLAIATLTWQAQDRNCTLQQIETDNWSRRRAARAVRNAAV